MSEPIKKKSLYECFKDVPQPIPSGWDPYTSPFPDWLAHLKPLFQPDPRPPGWFKYDTQGPDDDPDGEYPPLNPPPPMGPNAPAVAEAMAAGEWDAGDISDELAADLDEEMADVVNAFLERTDAFASKMSLAPNPALPAVTGFTGIPNTPGGLASREDMMRQAIADARQGNIPYSPPFYAPVPLIKYVAHAPLEDPEVVTGLFRQGEKVYLGGGSKTSKTWFLMHMAACIATGRPFLGRNTQKGRVIYANLELKWGTFANRWRHLLAGAKIPQEECDPNLAIWNFRAAGMTVELLLKWCQEIPKDGLSTIIIDPGYKLLRGRDENALNSAADLGEYYEQIAHVTGAAVVVAMHFPKGNHADKDHMDRIAGSGGFARDADSILTLTRHEEDDCFSFEGTVRSLPPVDPVVVRWNFPLFAIDAHEDPKKLRRPGRPGLLDSEVLEPLQSGPLRLKDWVHALGGLIGKSSLIGRRDRLIASGRVRRDGDLFELVSDAKVGN
jgi:hypothetical protein